MIVPPVPVSLLVGRAQFAVILVLAMLVGLPVRVGRSLVWTKAMIIAVSCIVIAPMRAAGREYGRQQHTGYQ